MIPQHTPAPRPASTTRTRYARRATSQDGTAWRCLACHDRDDWQAADDLDAVVAAITAHENAHHAGGTR